MIPPRESFWGTTAKDAAIKAGTMAGAWALLIAVLAGLYFGAKGALDLIGYQSTWTWWVSAYFVVGLILASLSAVGIFFGAWYWSAKRYGAPAFIMGWLPSAILAFVGWWLILPLWGVALLGGWAYNKMR